MKYTLILEDDNGEVLYKEDTQLHAVALTILDRMRTMEEGNLTVDQIRSCIVHWCEECREKFTPNKSDTFCDWCYDHMQADHQALEINETQNETAPNQG